MGIKKAFFNSRSAHCALIAVAAAGWQAQALAQADAAEPATSQGLEEIIVTAQRRAQNLQDVPVSVTAFSGETLTRAGIQKVLDLPQLDPALQTRMDSGVVQTFLRGVGNGSGQSAGNEASVPVYIDDIYYTRLYSSYLQLANVERVEVLKGPQGTLFGRNATGGLIQVFTRDPDKTRTELDTTLGYGNFDTFSGKIYAGTPLGDTAAIGLSVVGQDQRDGWGRNINLGIPTYREKYISARGKLVWDATETTHIRLIGFYTWGKTGQGQVQGQVANRYQPFTRGIPGTNLQFIPRGGFYDIDSSIENFTRNSSWGGSLKIEQELGFANFLSISSYRRARELFQSEGDQTNVDYLQYQLHTKDRQITQELQLRSNSESKVSWILGLFYLNSRQGYVPTDVFGGLVTSFGLDKQSLTGLQRVKSYAGFGQATFPVVDDRTNITLGLRYTIDKVSGLGFTTFTIGGVETPPSSVFSDSKTFKKLTYKVALDHEFVDNIRGYVSFSRGYKTGVYNTLPLNAPPTRPEVIDAYEVGLKTELLDRHLRLNVAAFQNDISDPQVSLINVDPNTRVAGAFFSNAKKARTKGFEADALLQVVDGLQLRASGQYLYAKYLDYADAPINVPLSSAPFGIITCSAVGLRLCSDGSAYTGPASGATGKRMLFAPKWRANAGFNYNLETSVGDFNFDGNVSYRSQIVFDPDNVSRQPGMALVDASIAFSPAALDKKVTIRGWVSNLTDHKYYLQISPSTGQVGYMSVPGAPRTYGLQIRYVM